MALQNAINRWNTLLIGGEDNDSLVSAIRNSASLQGDPMVTVPNNWEVTGVDPANVSDLTPVDASENLDTVPDTSTTNGKYSIYKTEWTGTPAPLGDIEGIDKVELFGFAVSDNSDHRFFGPTYGPTVPDDMEQLSGRPNTLTVNEPNRSATKVLDGDLYQDYFQSLEADYQQLKTDLPTHIQNAVIPAVQNGNIEHFLDGQTLLEDFSNANATDSTRLAAEALASGYSPPGDLGQQVKISHADLASDQWGQLYIRWVDNQSHTVSEDEIIESSDYQSAVFGFVAGSGEEFQSQILSGDATLKILKIEDGDSVEFDDSPVGAPPDPAEVSPEDIRAQMESLRQWQKNLEDRQTGGLFGGGSLFGGGIPDWLKLGGLAALALGALNALSG